MSSPASGDLGPPRIVVADEDQAIVAFVVGVLRQEGYAVFHAFDSVAAVELTSALDACHLVITNTRVQGTAGIELIHELRRRLPELPILYLANLHQSTPELEAQLPLDVPILREPFSAEELRSSVRPLLDGRGRAIVPRASHPPAATPS